MLETYFSTARRVITSASAMPWLDRPAAISSSTSRSRGVSCGERVVAAPPHERASRRCPGRWPSRRRHPADRRDEVLDIADPVLEQVADAVSGVGQQRHGEPELQVLRQHEHADRRVVAPDLQRGPHPLVGVRGRQTNVDDRDVERVGPDRRADRRSARTARGRRCRPRSSSRSRPSRRSTLSSAIATRTDLGLSARPPASWRPDL